MAELQALLAADWLPLAALIAGVAIFAVDNGGGLWTAAKAKAAKAWKSIRAKSKGKKASVKLSPTVILALIVAAASFAYQRDWLPVVQPNPPPVVEPVAPVDVATAAVYVYEQRETAIPSAVHAGISKLNEKVRATLHDVDTTDGDDQIPDQYKNAVPAAVAAGLPALVVLSGDKVLKVVPNPTTEEQVVGAVP